EPVDVPVDTLNVVVERRLESVELSHYVVEYLECIGEGGGDGSRQPHVLELSANLQKTAKSPNPPLPALPLSISVLRRSSVHVVVGEEGAAVNTQRLPDPAMRKKSRAIFSGLSMISTKTEMGGREDCEETSVGRA
ncbi:hypothetical protein PMAYCL1PPCAC_30254, partial [Pristionchus mayeri]